MINAILTNNNIMVNQGTEKDTYAKDNTDIALLQNEIDQLKINLNDDPRNREISKKDIENLTKKGTVEDKNAGTTLKTIISATAGFITGAAISGIQNNIEAAKNDEKDKKLSELVKESEPQPGGIRLTEKLTTNSSVVRLSARGVLNGSSLILSNYINQNFVAEAMQNAGTPNISGPGTVGLIGALAGGVHLIKSLDPLLKGVCSCLISNDSEPLLNTKLFGGIGDLAIGAGLISQTLGATAAFPVVMAGIGINTLVTAAEIIKS